jgi:sulfoxide reductase heme-binding subunit YedZ
MRLTSQQIDRGKWLLFTLGCFPLFRWLWLGWCQQLTANPVEFLTRSSGTWALVCLLFTLAVTPLRQLLKQPALVRVRRMCGLFAFFYASLHMLAWVAWDQDFEWPEMLKDITARPFIFVGALSYLTMALLALTSNAFSMRRLGKRWQLLHRLIYLIGGLVILHYWWHKAGKQDFATVSVYAGVLAVLLAWRVLYRFKFGRRP